MLVTTEEFDHYPIEKQWEYIRMVLGSQKDEIYGRISKIALDDGYMFVMPYTAEGQRVLLFQDIDENRGVYTKLGKKKLLNYKVNEYVEGKFFPCARKSVGEIPISIVGESLQKYASYEQFMKRLSQKIKESTKEQIEIQRRDIVPFHGKPAFHEWFVTQVESVIEQKTEAMLAEKEEASRKAIKVLEDESRKTLEVLEEETKQLEKNITNLEKEKNQVNEEKNQIEKEIEQLTDLKQKTEDKLEQYRKAGIVVDVEQKVKLGDGKHKSLELLTDDSWIYLWKREYHALQYDRGIIKRFLTALHTNQLIILWGKPGTGKTSLPNGIADAIGGKCITIPVQPNWTDNQDLLGFYNVVEKRYVPTLFLDTLVEARENPEQLYLVVLDEMNLAHVEYYFSEVLSAMEMEKPILHLYSTKYQKALDKKLEEIRELGKSEWNEQMQDMLTYPAEFEIPTNVRFIGTLNMDATTKDISPKVIDRSYLMEIEALEEYSFQIQEMQIQKKEGKNEFVGAKWFLPVSITTSAFRETMLYREIQQIKKTYLSDLKVSLSRRFDACVGQIYQCTGEDTDLDTIVLDKILPNVHGTFSKEQIACLERWKDECLVERNCEQSILKIEAMLKQEQDGEISYWYSYGM